MGISTCKGPEATHSCIHLLTIKQNKQNNFYRTNQIGHDVVGLQEDSLHVWGNRMRLFLYYRVAAEEESVKSALGHITQNFTGQKKIFWGQCRDPTVCKKRKNSIQVVQRILTESVLRDEAIYKQDPSYPHVSPPLCLFQQQQKNAFESTHLTLVLQVSPEPGVTSAFLWCRCHD